MYAIVRTGGRQFRAEPGHEIDVEKLPNEAGSSITLNEVLLVVEDNGTPHIGTPLVNGVTIKAKVVEHYRAKKVLVWKYKPGQRYRRTKGHRQTYTRLLIESIVGA